MTFHSRHIVSQVLAQGRTKYIGSCIHVVAEIQNSYLGQRWFDHILRLIGIPRSDPSRAITQTSIMANCYLIELK